MFFKKALKSSYDPVEHSEDYLTNAYALQFLGIMAITYVFIWILNLLHIFIIDSVIMRDGAIIFAILFVFAMIIHRIIGLEKPYCKYVYITLMLLVVTLINFFLTYHALLVMAFPIIFSVQYMDRKFTRYVLVMTIIGINFSTVFGFFYGLCDANMALLTVSTLAKETPGFISGAESVNSDAFLILLYYGIPRSMLILALSPLINHIADVIRDKAIKQEEHRRNAEMDSLSGLCNRNAFLIAAYRKYSQENFPCAFLFIDMDHFKNLNDTLGHQVGDMAIVDVSRAVKDAFRQNDILGRYGGDEFVAFIDNISEETLKERLKPLTKSLRKSYTFDDVTCNITGSIGAVFLSSNINLNFETMVELADKQAYRSKEAGRDRISIRIFGSDAEDYVEEFILTE